MTDTVTADDTAAPDDDQSPNPSRTMEIVAAAASLAFMGLVLGLALNISLRAEAGPGQIDAKFWPMVLAITGIGLSLAQLVVAVVRPAPEREDLDAVQTGGYRRVGATLIATALFVVAWNIGSVIAFGYRIELFPIAATIFLAVLIAVYGARGWKAYVFFPLPMALLAYLLFSVVLRIPL